MNPFAYASPARPESAAALARDGGRYLAGGIDLIGEMKESLASPSLLVNLKHLPGTRDIALAGSTWRIGTNVTIAEIAAHRELGASLPGLAAAAAAVGSPEIRNQATLGGNLAQHSRCWYYRHRDIHCRKKGGTRCFARIGENKYHSLFTGCLCVSPAVSNLAVALAALNACVAVLRSQGIVQWTIPQLYAAAWTHPTAHNSLGAGDLILHADIPADPAVHSAYLQVSERSGFDWALVSCAAAVRVAAGVWSDVRIVLGAVAPVPWEVEAANRYLEGRRAEDTAFDQAADLVLREAVPLSGNTYKLALARALVKRTLRALAPA